jgi:hypothetical protein
MGDESAGVFAKIAGLTDRLLNWLNSLTKAVALGLVVAVMIASFGSIVDGVRGLAEHLPNIAKISAFGGSVEMNLANVDKDIKSRSFRTEDLSANWGDAQSKNAVEGIKALDRKSLIRLMNVGLLKNVCKFQKPTADMTFDYAADISLDKAGLIQIQQDPETLERVLAEIRKRESGPRGKPSDIGYPTDCYNLSLTSKGFDVRTALAGSIVASLDPNSS